VINILRSAFCILALSLVLGCLYPAMGIAQNGKFTQPMAKDPSVAVWGYDPQGEMMVAAMIKNVEGKVAVCGFWTISKRLSPYIKETGLDRITRGNANIVVKGVVVMHSLRTFKKVSLDNFAVGTVAPCKVTPHAWHSSFSNKDVVIRTPSTTAIN